MKTQGYLWRKKPRVNEDDQRRRKVMGLGEASGSG